MKRMLKAPVVNAVCISLFSTFYATVYIIMGRPLYIALPLVVLTAIIATILLKRRQRYDEYHASILANCLITALVLTMIAIAIFYLIILCYPTDIDKKFGIFIDVHWVTVVLSDIAYMIICRKK